MHLAILHFLIIFKQYKWLDYEFMNVAYTTRSRRNANRNIFNNIRYLLIILMLLYAFL